MLVWLFVVLYLSCGVTIAVADVDSRGNKPYKGFTYRNMIQIKCLRFVKIMITGPVVAVYKFFRNLVANPLINHA